jgi:hypothetical protein
MTMRVLFNGAVLVRPGGATKIDASAFQSAGVAGVGVVGLVGEATGGEPGVLQIFSSPAAAKAVLREGALADAVSLAFNPMKDARVPGGASSVVCVRTNAGTQASLALLDGATTVATLKSKDYGLHTNRLSAAIATSGTGQIVTIKFVDGQRVSTETSSVLGGTAEMQIQYTGTGSACALTIDGTSIRTVVTGTPADGLTLNYSEFATLADLITFVHSHPSYSCTAVTRNPYTITPRDLDYVSAQAIKAAAYDVFAKLYRVVEWVNVNSALVTATLPTSIIAMSPPDVISETAFTGGTRGVSTNAAFSSGLDLLKRLRVNQVVSLISDDLTGEGFGSTATFTTTGINTEQHATYCTSTVGKNERHAFIGMAGTKTEVLDYAALTLNSFNACLVAQRPLCLNSAGEVVEMPEWALAVIAAGARAGSELGEPLTWKYLNIYGLSQDASWDPLVDGDAMVLGGVLMAEEVPGKGYRWVKGVTTYTRDDNDAYTEESVVQGWKLVSYEFRTHLEDLFIGRRMALSNISAIKQAAEAKLSALRDSGQIVDSVVNGATTRAYRKLVVSGTKDQVAVSAEVSPVEGINFMLNSLFLVPATFTV